MNFRLFKKIHCYRPTILGLLIIILVIFISISLALPNLYNFLFLNKSIESKTMVIEGWVPSYALIDAIEYYNDNNYENLIVTGIPMTQYEYASDFKFTSQATILALKHFGFSDTIYEARIPTNIYKDRTYSTAIASEEIFKLHPEWEKTFNIYSMGVHSRRSLILFKKAFKKEFDIGIIAHTDRAFVGEKWWESSIGFRNVSNEVLATTYAKFFFHPEKENYLTTIGKGTFYDTHQNARMDKHFKFIDTTRSRFNKQEIKDHTGFKYFDIDESYNITAIFTVDTSHKPFEMATTTDRKPIYRIYGYLDFNVRDTSLRLTAYQNMGYINHPEHGNSLFIPFTDLTNGISSYGAGRYIDITIPVEDTVKLDFNNCYNPYCAYSKRWSCPLVPYDNHLSLKINAGEKKYK